MMVTYKAANENDWFQPETDMSKRYPRGPCHGIRFIVPASPHPQLLL
jgi:hypothetical protein